MKSATVEVEVVAIGHDGLGIGTCDGRTVHVKGALPRPGSLQPVRIVKRRRGHWYGLVEGPAPRTLGHCAAYPVCGGCAMLHLSAATQLAVKERHVLALLDSFGVAPEETWRPYAGPRYFYRRRARLGVRHLATDDTTLVGFRESFGSRVARIETCPILTEPLHAALPELKRTLQTLDARARIPQVEVSAGDTHGAMIVRHLDPLSPADLRRLAQLERASGLSVLLQPAGLESVVPVSDAAVPRLRYRLDEFGVTLAFDPLDFVQVNARVNRALVAAAVAWLGAGAGEHVIDLFTGIGNFALPIARTGAVVTAVEAGRALVERAARNALENGVATRVECVAADLYGALPASLQERLRLSDAALLDPPRTGLGHLADAIPTPGLGRVVYVSCYPESFARDAALLVERGFRLQRLALFDMFPHTAHVETLALFARR